ncbi:MAG: aromatic-ring-hydroxylating dioxygenase beta subunit [Polaromonas sp.]|nr:aromatic-ring-hydroxylating dioxygenase beta subunit [Polaromonas sp.]
MNSATIPSPVRQPAALADVPAAPSWRDLVLKEAALLDARRFTDWLDLFDEAGHYWMPADPAQSSPENHLSLFFEPRRVLVLRVERLLNPRTHVQVPPSRTHHHVSEVRLLNEDAVTVHAESMQLVIEHRKQTQRMFSARVTHHLVLSGGHWRIMQKRVDLIDCDAAHRALPFPL